jgi:hypothetical protein
VRSYASSDLLNGVLVDDDAIIFESWRGGLRFAWAKVKYMDVWGDVGLAWSSRPAAEEREFRDSRKSVNAEQDFMGFGARSRRGRWTLAVPHWFVVAIAGGLAVAVRPPPRWRFTLRSLLIAISIVAFALGGAMTMLPRRPWQF